MSGDVTVEHVQVNLCCVERVSGHRAARGGVQRLRRGSVMGQTKAVSGELALGVFVL